MEQTANRRCLFSSLIVFFHHIKRGEAGGWLLCRSLDCTDLLRVYRHIDYPLPLQPVQEAKSLGIELPPELLNMLAELADILEAKLRVRLDQMYPVNNGPAADTEELPA